MFVLTVSLVITNIFIPVKYLSSYIVFTKDEREADTARVRFLDVGYGGCTVIEFPDGKTMLIDGGDGSYSQNKKLLSVLNKSGINFIDYLVCTSVKSGHCGGLAEVIKYKKVGTIYSPYCKATYITAEYHEFDKYAKRSGATLKYCEYGEGEEGEEYSFYFLKPSAHTIDDEFSEYYQLNSDPTRKNINDASAVLWVEIFGCRFLLTGDLQEDKLSALCDEHELTDGFYVRDKRINFADCTFLQLPNHGATESVCPPLIELTSPECAILSVGENGFGAPDVGAVTGAQQVVGDKLYRTDKDGDITIKISDGKYSVSKEKV